MRHDARVATIRLNYLSKESWLAAYLVVSLKLETLLDASPYMRMNRMHWIGNAYDALRPMGLTLIMPFRNSINVPL